MCFNTFLFSNIEWFLCKIIHRTHHTLNIEHSNSITWISLFYRCFSINDFLYPKIIFFYFFSNFKNHISHFLSLLYNAANAPRDFKPIVSGPHLQVYENGSLSIQDARDSDAGYYLCQASNDIGQGLSKVVKISVHGEFGSVWYNLYYNLFFCIVKWIAINFIIQFLFILLFLFVISISSCCTFQDKIHRWNGAQRIQY